MKSLLIRLLIAVLVITAGFFLWRVFSPTQEQLIRKQLAELARAASFSGNESPLAKLANSQGLASFFTPDVEITVDVPGHARQTFSGRDEVIQAAAGARAFSSGFTVEFLDINVALQPDKVSAAAEFTARGRIAGDRDMLIQEMKLHLKNTPQALYDSRYK